MKSSHETLVKSKELKDARNMFFKSGVYLWAIRKYDKALQYLCVEIPNNVDDANLMEELRVSIELNLAACWLKLRVWISKQ